MFSRHRLAQSSTIISGKATATQRTNLAILFFYSLSIISICLTIFNLYLFVWIWSSLSGSNSSLSGTSAASHAASSAAAAASQSRSKQISSQLSVDPAASNQQQLSLFDQLELLRDENKLSFGQKLFARKSFNVRGIKRLSDVESDDSNGAPLKLSSKNEVQFKINATSAESAQLVLSARRASLDFPSGLIVHSSSESRATPSVECRTERGAGSSSNSSFCHLRAKHFKLSHPEGVVDFSALKSIQTGHLRTRRLHSSLNKLQLMTGGGGGGGDDSLILFESLNDQVHLRALDLVSLGSRNTTVIIKAKTIKLGDLVEISSSDQRELAKQHKLCVCLHRRQHEKAPNNEDDEFLLHREREEHKEEKRENSSDANNGLVFAIQNHLRCSQFSETLCTSGSS